MIGGKGVMRIDTTPIAPAQSSGGVALLILWAAIVVIGFAASMVKR